MKSGSRILLFVAAGLILAATLPSRAQTTVTNGVQFVSPATAVQGESDLLVTFTLATGTTPPPPAAGVMPTTITLGTNRGTSITHASQYVVTARFSIAANEAAGWKDAAVTFPRPSGGPLTFARAAAFEVQAGAPVLAAGFSAGPTNGPAPLLVVFTDASSGTITNRQWNFGDGSASTDLNPVHTFLNPGDYTVALTVSGPGGTNLITRAAFIRVTTAPTNLGAFPVVDTAQSICYNQSVTISPPASGAAWSGQDAQHAGNAPRYRDNGDGSVTDLVTGLMWQQDPGAKVTFAAAVAGAGLLTLGGHNDWRLPTIKELYSLILFNGSDASSCMAPGAGACTAKPFLDTNYFRFEYGNTNAGERIIDAQFWSATEYVSTTMGGNATVFGVNFADGRIKGYPRDTGPGGAFTEFCRYVRGNPNYGVNLLLDHGDGRVTDRATGLMWTRDDSGTGLNWSNALAWVQARNAANHLGHNDWRLPDAKELQTLVDYTRSPATTRSAAISPAFHCTAIIDEGGRTNWPFYWAGTTHADSTGNGSFAVYVCFGEGLGWMTNAAAGGYELQDVHGAGAQRSDPKSGSATNYPHGHGPQGDVVRIINFVRLVRTASTFFDTVGDGIPNAWREARFGDGVATNGISCAGCDPDHDGSDNGNEYVAATDPGDAMSVFRAAGNRVAPAAVTFQSATNRLHTLWRRENLHAGSWQPVAGQTDIAGTGGAMTLSDPGPPTGQCFYRVGVRLP